MSGHRADKPKVFWTADDWLAETAALQQNVALAKANPGFLRLTYWQALLEQTTREAQKAGLEWEELPLPQTDPESLPTGLETGFTGHPSGDPRPVSDH